MRQIILVLLTLFFWGAFGVLAGPSSLVKGDINAEYESYMHQKYCDELDRFIEAVGQRESSGDYTVINRIGAMGKWQFTTSTLKMLGYHKVTPLRFRRDPDIFPPDMQREAFVSLLDYNEAILHDFIVHYDGLVIKDVFITKGGILAAAHLGGAGAVKAWLLSYGRIDPSDGLTHISDYMKEFAVFRLKKDQ